jgi:hypothetical protein
MQHRSHSSQTPFPPNAFIIPIACNRIRILNGEIMSDPFERNCANWKSFFRDTFAPTENGICLADDAFEPYLDDLLDYVSGGVWHIRGITE